MLGIINIILLVTRQLMRAVLKFIDQVMQQTMDHRGFTGWKAPHVMKQPGHIKAVNSAKIRHGQPAVFARQIGMIIDALFNSGF